MSFLDEIMAMDAAAFTDPDLSPGVETLIYVKVDGPSRPFNAQVFRGGLDLLPGFNEATSPKCEIFVANIDDGGISSAELENGDRVKLDLKLNGNIVSLAIIRPGDDGRWRIDNGMLRLGLR